MQTKGRWIGRAAVLCWVTSSMFAACARPVDLGDVGGSGGASVVGSGGTTTGSVSGTGGAPITGETGGPCVKDDQCSSGMCTQVGDKKFCTVPCPPDCPAGTYCSIIQGDPMCIPDLGQQCAKCISVADCAMPTDQCFKAPPGDTFCSRDCTTMGICPDGFTCVEGAVYLGGGMMDGGVPDAGGSDAGDGGAKPPAGMPTKWCVPNDGASCPCNEKRDGVTHTCHNLTPSGDCTGTETCNGEAAKWEGCTASTPKPETCNTKDDNCNGAVDDGDQNALCADLGPKPPHGNWLCDMGTCKAGKCDPGWSAFPPGPPAAGCSCPLEMGEPNGTCNSVVTAGTATDMGGPINFQGTLSAVNDVDIWRVDTTDLPEGGTNSYHVSIDFTSPAVNNEFVMDVTHGDPCVAAPAGPSSNITAYDWCVDGNGGALIAGEAPCGEADNLTHCGDHSAPYYIRVYRKLGAVGSCVPYTIQVKAHGGARPCDFSKKCEM